MLFQIDSNAATAVYRQLVDQISFAAASGTLKPRDPLPTIRPLARQLHLNRNTVAKAYTELENLGVIKTIPGKGCFIEPVKTPFTPAVRQKLLIAKIDAALIAAHQLQIDAKTFAAAVAERAKVFERKTAMDRKTRSEEVTHTRTNQSSTATAKSNSTLTSTAPPPSIKTPISTPAPAPSSSADDAGGWTPGTD
jgi:GntR family transcriptional regulator